MVQVMCGTAASRQLSLIYIGSERKSASGFQRLRIGERLMFKFCLLVYESRNNCASLDMADSIGLRMMTCLSGIVFLHQFRRPKVFIEKINS